MAKKKRRITEEPVEEYEFRATEFDEREFIYKDIHGTKVLAVITVIAIAVGIFAAGLISVIGASWAWALATLLSFVVCYLLKKILMAVGFRPDLLEFKTLLGSYFLYLCLALGVCIIFVNPPFF